MLLSIQPLTPFFFVRIFKLFQWGTWWLAIVEVRSHKVAAKTIAYA